MDLLAKMSEMRQGLLRCGVGLVAGCLCGAAQGTVFISEVMAKNDETIETANGKMGLDWIELHNDGTEDVNVADWFLSDNPKKSAEKWKKIACDGPVVVPAGGYRLIWADKDYDDYTADEAHVAIGLSTEGERIFLAPPDTKDLDEDSAFEFGRQIKDVSYGLDADGVTCYFREPTPGTANTTRGFGPPTPEVEFSEPHGFKTGPFELTMMTPDPLAEIYYTTNGVEPTIENGIHYDGTSLIIARTALIRATVPDATSVRQTVTTATYLFVDDILAQGPNPGGDFPATNKVNSQSLEFGLNAKIVSDYRNEVADALTNSIPVYSVVGDVNDLFGATTGIYVNAGNKGRAWERKMSVELFDPLAREDGFQIDCGVKMRGANSRIFSPKHSFRLVFRSEYGAGKLNYPLFGDEGTQSFDKIDLRTDQNNSWAMDNGGYADFVHEVFCRDVQRDQGRPYTRSRYCHLYLNGQYWGLYQTQERDDSSYAETYLGGESSDWDFVRTTLENQTFVTDAVDGSVDAFLALMNLTNAGIDDAMYHRMMGQNPDGTENLGYPVYLDEENLMDYIIGLHYEHDADSPWSLPNGLSNNMHALYNRNARQGFVWMRHDAEYSLGTHWFYPPSSSCLRWGSRSSFNRRTFTPAGLHACLEDGSPQYRRRFAERLDAQVFCSDGVLAYTNAMRRFSARTNEVAGAVWAEAARWGRGKFLKGDWERLCNSCSKFISNRPVQLKEYYTHEGWYPRVERPIIAASQEDDLCLLPITISSEAGTVLCWTDDGSDPAESSTVQSNGTSFVTYVIGTNSVKLLARAYDPIREEWSLIARASIEVKSFTVADRQRMYLRVAGIDVGRDCPFVEITNTSNRFSIPLEGLRLGELMPGVLIEACLSNGVVKIPLVATPDLSREVAVSFVACDGQLIQALSFSTNWPGLGSGDNGTVYFIPRHFGSELTTKDDWYPWFGFLNDEGMLQKVGGARDLAIASNITTLMEGVHLIEWAYRHGMNFEDMLTNECVYLSFVFDTSRIIGQDWVENLRSEDIKCRELICSPMGELSFSLMLRDLIVGDSPSRDHLGRLFSIVGACDLEDGFKPANVELMSLPSSDGRGGLRFEVRSAVVPSGNGFFIKTTFCP